MSNFGDELKKIRTEFNVTMIQLQKHSGISQSYISQLENGKRQPTEDAIDSLVHGLAFSDTGYIGSIKENQLKERLLDAQKKDKLASVSSASKDLAKQLNVSDEHLDDFYNIISKTIDENAKEKFIALEQAYYVNPKVYFTVSGEPLSAVEQEALKIFVKGIKSNRR